MHWPGLLLAAHNCEATGDIFDSQLISYIVVKSNKFTDLYSGTSTLTLNLDLMLCSS